MEESEKITIARQLMDEFADRTLSDGNLSDRYLWTDAFAAQTFFGLYHATGEKEYQRLALQLIDQVHQTLGRFRADDERKGWISGLSEKEGAEHPTFCGLRIGKEMSERKEDEALDNRLEWEKDGQYFHYITRWAKALFLAAAETKEEKYALWATELVEVTEKFIYKVEGIPRMYWKMSIDLSRPLVPSMGVHDPLEGAILAKFAKERFPQKTENLKSLIEDLKEICEGMDWSTEDSLGLGGLLLNIPKSVVLKDAGLPPSLQPEKLFSDVVSGMQTFIKWNAMDSPAEKRLAFRECGLSLGIRVMKGFSEQTGFKAKRIESYLPIADEIESFWSNPDHHNSHTWNDHLNINSVNLAATLTARVYPQVFLPTLKAQA